MLHTSIFLEDSSLPLQVLKGRWKRVWPELLGVAVALVFAFSFLNVVPGPDVAWQLWIAHQIRMGARLYVDIIETNPPLWFWQAVPFDWASAVSGVPSHVLLVVTTGCAAAISVFGTGRLIRYIPANWRAILLVYAALTLLLMPLVDTGQREQFMLIGMLPYAALAASRRGGRSVRPLSAVMVAIGAALGLALKHYFLGVPLFIEIWLLAGQWPAYRAFRPETVTLLILAAVYAILVVTITPSYLTHMLEINQLAYASRASTTWSDMFRPIQAYWLIALAPIALEFGTLKRSPLASAMAVSALGFWLAWFIQFRGFPYHSIPASGCLMMTLACFVVENRRSMRGATLVTAPTILLLPLGFTAWYGPNENGFASYSQAMIAGVRPHESVAFINYEAIFSWPLSLYRDAPYPSRQYGFWILGAAARDHGHTPALTRVAKQVVEETAQDFRCSQPVRIIFSRKVEEGRSVKTYFDASKNFSDVLSHYRLTRKYLIFDIYELTNAFAKPPYTTCRRNF